METWSQEAARAEDTSTWKPTLRALPFLALGTCMAIPCLAVSPARTLSLFMFLAQIMPSEAFVLSLCW